MPEHVTHYHVLRFPGLERALEFGVAFYRVLRDDIGLERLAAEPRVVLLVAPHVDGQARPVEFYANDVALAVVRAHNLPCTPGEVVLPAGLPPGCLPFVGIVDDRNEGSAG